MRVPPTSSGSAAVGAAIIAPVGAYVISFNVMAERSTISRHRPEYRERSTHRRQ
ncbi:hypothetical protein GCM10027452_12030 [Micromonospora halotolerans]